MPWQAQLILAIILALAAGGAASASWTAYAAFARRRRAVREPEPRCGRCGYIVHPESPKVCPECGSYFADVGIATPAFQVPPFPFLALWLCCVGASLLAWWAGPRVAAMTPWGWDFHAGYQVHTSRTRWVPSMHEAAFGVNARGFGRGWGARVRELNVSYKVPEGYWITLDIDLGGAWCLIRTRPSAIGPMPLNADAIGRFVEAAGFDPASEEGIRLRDEILAKVREFLAHKLPEDSGGTAGDWPGRTQFDSIQFWPNEYAGWVAGLLVWVMTTAASIITLRRWQRRRRAAVIREGRSMVAQLRLT
jgi:hypothetical protein